ncbi:hypothetical protein G9C98_003789 [Cotesia typhae]|uniref:Uncharacterized protein n=1 Tax=Cotesia typhae TaxID=2053667 RepID=A0A8J5UQU5_9HYME|nr:hypothetical protein G9C98_003789 [Cotesia typhae]
MSDEIKNLDESRESSSNENSPSKRVFILTSEMVKRLGLDEKIKIFKNKVKVDTSIKPVSVVQIDKDKSQLIIPKTSNEESNSDVQNKSSSNNEGSNDIKDVLPDSSGNENDVEKKDKEASKKSIVHHVETLEKPLIIRRSPSKNGIVVLKSQSTGNENEKSLPKNKLKVIGDHKKLSSHRE